MNKNLWFASLLILLTLTLVQPAQGAPDNTAPSSPVKLIFIHHSTGGNWLSDTSNTDQPAGGLGAALMANNYYVSATNYGWGPDAIGDSTDIPNWPQWFTGSNSSTILAALYNENGQNVGDFGSWSRLAADPGGENEIIMFKSCFPNSDLFGNPTDAAATTPDDQYTVSNAKAVYNNLLTYFQTRTDKLFIVITAPPQNENDYYEDYQTAAQRAANARAFNNWLVNDWLDSYPYSNVAVFDYYNVLTAADNHHRWNNNQIEHVTSSANNFAAYPSGEWDSHPSSAGQQKATSEFVDLLNYSYNTWRASQTGSSGGQAVHLTRMSLSPAVPQLNSDFEVTVEGASSTGSQLFYQFSSCANYGTAAYDSTPWTIVKNYSSDSSATFRFDQPGDYIVVVRAVTDPGNEPTAIPMIGQVVSVAASGEVNIAGLATDLYTSPNAGDPVTFTANASNPAGQTLYYSFWYCANYGTDSYATTPWTLVRDYSTSPSCQLSFPSDGNYVVVARAVTDPSNENSPLPIIGQTVSVGGAIQVSSSAFTAGSSIPRQYTCDGSDISPPLQFAGIPSGTRSLVLICDDPDAPYGTFVHWVLYNLPPDATSLAEDIPGTATLDIGAQQGQTDFGGIGYGGPCPPSGTHRYYFKVYALDTTLTLNEPTKDEVMSAMAGHILAEGQLLGTYGN